MTCLPTAVEPVNAELVDTRVPHQRAAGPGTVARNDIERTRREPGIAQ